ncbi:hypothetical protein [Rhodoferax sp.]|uniref:hypothetical protein n=1 Tax=Rhodoferax sp. TaxID=50421 RepID=UPI0028412F38|nr:hypothetical protein [Rhodoferax sp.]MDR3367549.1 hypothetical protein [Rhodoferax sp.]
MRKNLLRLWLLAALISLAACGGVLMRSLPHLMRLQSDLLVSNPAEFLVALQVDARLLPPANAVPMLIIKLVPREPGAFEVIDKKLPLQVMVSTATTLGLESAPPGRRWLIYSLPAVTQIELLRLQQTIKLAKALPNGRGAGSLGVGVEQDSLAVTTPALANTRWDTWMQTRQRDGFFEVWSGTPAELQRIAAKNR